MNGTYTGVIDRIVDGQTAVVLVEEDDAVIEQFDIPVKDLPDDARDGGLLSVVIEHDEIVNIEFLPEKTSDRRAAIQDKLDRVSRPLSEIDDSDDSN